MISYGFTARTLPWLRRILIGVVAVAAVVPTQFTVGAFVVAFAFVAALDAQFRSIT